MWKSLINESADFAAIDANLLSVITDEGSPVAGCDLSSEDFDHCDQEFYRDILDGVIKGKGELLETLSRHLDRDPQRLSVVERACLMIGTWEIFPEILLLRRVLPRFLTAGCILPRVRFGLAPCVRRKSSRLTAFARSICAWVYCMGVLLTS